MSLDTIPEARRQIEIGVGGAREAVDATVFAAAIRIDRLVEGHIGGLIVGDHRSGLIRLHDGGDSFDDIVLPPAVVLGVHGRLSIAAFSVRECAAAFERVRVHRETV